jgi:SagB-type dehydrogenase family enzyme
MEKPGIDELRFFLKDSIRKTTDFSRTDQSLGLPPPPVEKPFAPDAHRTALPKPEAWQGIGTVALADAIRRRSSRREFLAEPLSLDELAFLLWATQGVRRAGGGGAALRTVPSAGARHALETYLCVLTVTGVTPGIYRYLPVEHELLFEAAGDDLAARVASAAFGQSFVGRGAVTFIWAAVPYRMEWRYGPASHKVIAIDAGHVCQNLYLACEAIGAGTCAVAAYDQDAMDQLLRLDGRNEFAVYLAPVGKVK